MAIALLAALFMSGCAPSGASTRRSPAWKADCTWESWVVLKTTEVGEETKSSLDWNITQGDVAKVVVKIRYQSSFKKQDQLKRECCNPCQDHYFPVQDCVNYDYKNNRCREYKTAYRKDIFRQVKNREFKTDEVYHVANKAQKIPMTMTIGPYERELSLTKIGEDGGWAIYEAEALFRVGTDGASLSNEKPGGIPRDILAVKLSGKEEGKLYLYSATDTVTPKSEKSDKDTSKGLGDWRKAITK